ncbi:N-6 DNA methylase [Pararhodonellum marinum]|uniref:N-6 DNA methylase n=1 Tax=Pararhodonellum marinum TaxID=2755358 RepID=UPI001E4CD9ED|nr:N-6 DNA methylase [Pararhodonellum marinum]
MLKDGHIDTVIGLPANLFFSTGIPVCILVLKRCKRFEDVLFINAAEHYEKGKRQNVLREGEGQEPNDIRKIVETYQFRKEEEQYSRRVSMEEIEKNDWNLNISRYVSTTQAEEIIDLEEVHNRLTDIDRRAKEAREKHNTFLRELGLREI